ncbi:hypothetical protein ACFQYP_32920 [Nonomuraea antimicrobica]|uniref:hypothetical protein n=1 Tax=Nonomuraea antimicrobica TaxID=561173 RepID=UPI0031EE1205
MKNLPTLLFVVSAGMIGALLLAGVAKGSLLPWANSDGDGCNEASLAAVGALDVDVRLDGAVEMGSDRPGCDEEDSYASTMKVYAYEGAIADLVPAYEKNLHGEGWKPVERPMDFPVGEGCFHKLAGGGMHAFLLVWASDYQGANLKQYRIQLSISPEYHNYGGRMC